MPLKREWWIRDNHKAFGVAADFHGRYACFTSPDGIEAPNDSLEHLVPAADLLAAQAEIGRLQFEVANRNAIHEARERAENELAEARRDYVDKIARAAKAYDKACAERDEALAEIDKMRRTHNEWVSEQGERTRTRDEIIASLGKQRDEALAENERLQGEVAFWKEHCEVFKKTVDSARVKSEEGE